MRFLTLALALGIGAVNAQTQGCVVTPMSKGNVCKCTEDLCDSVQPLGNLIPKVTVAIYETEKNSNHYLTRLPDQTFGEKPSIWGKLGNLAGTLVIDPNTQYQSITGFGGAFSDAAALTWANMTTKIQSLLIDQYFSDAGLQYNLGRIPMGGTDFSTHSYSYDDTPNDFSWSRFSVAEDEPVKIPFIKAAVAKAASRGIKLFASPWSPPAWMKWYGSAIQGGLNGTAAPGDKFHDAWAQYFVKFIDAYQARGIKIWGVTIQNEPLTGGGSNKTSADSELGRIVSALLGTEPTPKWDSNFFTVEGQRDFIKNNWGPALRKAYPDIKLIAWDDNNDIFDQVSTILSDPEAAKYVDGLGIHWYNSYEGRLPQFKKMTEVHNKFPKPFILPTEACEGYLPWSRGPWPGEWDRGMTYANDILNDLINWGVGWTDWNLFLDMKGGPNHVGNNVDAPILLDTTLKNVFYKQPMYYALGHFSKFVPAGSVRLKIQNDGNILQSVAFLTPDGNTVMILLNIGIIPVNTYINNGNGGYVLINTKPRSIQTVIFKKPDWARISANDQAVIDDVDVPMDATAPATGSTSMLSSGALIGISVTGGILIGMALMTAAMFMRRRYAAKQQATVTHIHEAQSAEIQQL